MARLSYCLAMFWLVCTAIEIIMIMEVTESKVDVHTIRLSLSAVMAVPIIWTVWLMIQKIRFWCIYGVDRCCVKNCPVNANLRPVRFPLLGVQKLACEYHEDAVINHHGQGHVVLKSHCWSTGMNQEISNRLDQLLPTVNKILNLLPPHRKMSHRQR